MLSGVKVFGGTLDAVQLTCDNKLLNEIGAVADVITDLCVTSGPCLSTGLRDRNMWVKRSASMHLDYVMLLSFPTRRTSVKRIALAVILFISIQPAAQTSVSKPPARFYIQSPASLTSCTRHWLGVTPVHRTKPRVKTLGSV